MKQPTQKKDETELSTTPSSSNADNPAAVSLEVALLACMHDDDRPKVACLDDSMTEANTVFPMEETEDNDMAIPHPARVRSSTPLESAVLACMPGAYHVPGPPFASTTTGASYVDPLRVVLEDEEERSPVSATTTTDMERGDRQQSAQTNIVSAYRVAEAEPVIIAMPFKDNKFRILVYGLLIIASVALVVGLSVGLTTKGTEAAKEEQTSDRLVSSVLLTADQEGAFIKGERYIRAENGREIATTTGSAVVNYCDVLPCNEGGCDFAYGKVYKPGCCRGDDCNPSDKCGRVCPNKASLCHPSFVGCKDASCFECERGPNGENLYAYRSASFNMNCLRTGVATGLDDIDDDVMHIYKWAIICGYVIRGGDEWQNLGPGEYLCGAVRSGDGITKTVSQIVPCQFIQLLECGCGPDDMHTSGLLPPDKPCKTKEDCPYLCGDAGEKEAKTLCEAFPGIEWWEGENPTYQSLFARPEENFFAADNVTIQIVINGEG